MVISTDSDIFTPFPQMIIEDGPQSSEDGSGLHSPIFSAHFPQPHGDSIRYHQDHLDIQHAASILAPQFDYNNNSLAAPHHPHHLLETPLDLHPNPHHHSSYHSEYPLPSRNQLGLDFTPHAYPNTRLPPPPAQGTQVNLSYQGPLHRRYSTEDSHHHHHSYSSGGSSAQPSVPQPPESTQRSPVPRSEPVPQQHPAQPAASTSQDPPPREISNQVIACRQCRARKIRCDSTRPICHNCVRRSNECQYDAAPKRRGPDKRPGTRQRSCKKRPSDGSTPPSVPPKRKRVSSRSDDIQVTREPREIATAAALRPDGDRIRLQPSLSPGAGFSSSVHPRAASDDTYSHQVEKYRVSSTTLQYNRKEWWDNLVMTYSATRDQSLKDIASDLSTLFTASGYWLSFVNVPDFVSSLYNPEDRSLMQPSFVFAGLALATLMKSSEMELGSAGRERAIWLRDKAQGWLEASWNSQWIDITLAKAALIIAVYESSAHSLYTPERARRSMTYLDGIVSQLGLSFLDSNEPDVSMFALNAVPVVHRRRAFDLISTDGIRSPHSLPRKCDCIPIPTSSSIATDHLSSSWSFTPPWDPSWTPEEMHKESCRRICWSALNLVARYTSHCIAFEKEPIDLFLTDPSNFRLLFPGEVSERGSNEHKTQSPKDSIWALYCRSMLLWNFCTTRLRKNVFNSTETAELALEAWSETLEIQDALDAHTCNIDLALLYMSREYMYNTQMMITQILRTVHADSGNPPQFNRKLAEQWLYYQGHFIRRVKMSIHHLGEQDNDLFTRQPFQVTWFASQVATCLSLWENDKALVEALEVAKDTVVPLDVMNSLWPCPMLQGKCDELRKRVTEACHSVNISPPLPPNCSLPSHVRP